MIETNPKAETVRFKKFKWVDIVAPDQAVFAELKKKYKFHELDLEDCASENQRSKIDEYDKYLFIILHFPHFDKRKNAVVIEEIDIFMGHDYLITMHDGVLYPLMDIFERCKSSLKSRKKTMSNGTGFLLYEIVDTMLNHVFFLLDQVSKNIKTIEMSVFGPDQEQKDMLRDILGLKKDIITFRRVMGPQRTVIAQLEHKNKKFLPENLDLYFDDLVDKVEKIWGNLESMKDLVISLQETNESIISHKTNDVIKVLTVFSATMLPLTVLTGFYGMNVALPMAEYSIVYFLIIGGMALISLTMVIFFKMKKWL